MFLEQLAEDTKQYVKAVFTTLVATVPKAIIHAQVPTTPPPYFPHLLAYSFPGPARKRPGGEDAAGVVASRLFLCCALSRWSGCGPGGVARWGARAGVQVKMSQEHLLERLYAYVTGLKPMELDGLLDEDSEVTQKRAAAQMSIKVAPARARARIFSHKL